MKYLLLLLLLSVFFVSAQEVPSIPMVVHGSVMINDELAPAGTLVAAKVGNVTVKEYTLIGGGDYLLTIVDGEFGDSSIELFVNDVFADQTIEFSSGGVVDRELNVVIKEDFSFSFVFLLLVLFLLLLFFWMKKSKGFKKGNA